MASEEPPILHTAQVAELLGLQLKTVLRMAKDGRLPARRIPGTRRFLFLRDEIMDLVDRSVVAPAKTTEADAAEAEAEDALSGE